MITWVWDHLVYMQWTNIQFIVVVKIIFCFISVFSLTSDLFQESNMSTMFSYNPGLCWWRSTVCWRSQSVLQFYRGEQTLDIICLWKQLKWNFTWKYLIKPLTVQSVYLRFGAFFLSFLSSWDINKFIFILILLYFLFQILGVWLAYRYRNQKHHRQNPGAFI